MAQAKPVSFQPVFSFRKVSIHVPATSFTVCPFCL